MTSIIAQNLAEIESRVVASCSASGRRRSEVKIVAVSKTFSSSLIREAIGCGQTVFGENYIPEGSLKAREIKQEFTSTEFHFIGHLQRNKVRAVVAEFDLIQTVDRFQLAEEIEKEAKRAGKKVPILLQVNISNEETKSGCNPNLLRDLGEKVLKMNHLSLQGIMSIGSAINLDMSEEKSISIVTQEFKEMGELKRDLESHLGFSLPELSMGMSGDFELAVSFGATIIRIGTAIFGSR